MDDLEKQDITLEKATDKDLTIDKPLSFGDYLKLDLTEEERDLHTHHICKRIDEILDDADRREIIEKVATWRNQYYGLVAETNFPWTGAFNLDIRMTPKIQDAVVAQTEEAFDDVDPRWTVPYANERMKEIAKRQEKVLDYHEDIAMSNNEDLEAIRHDAYLLGLGWEAVLFERKIERIRGIKIYNNLESFVKDYPNDWEKYPSYIQKLSAGETVKVIAEYNHEAKRTPTRKHVEFEDVICPSNAKGVEGVNNTDLRGRRVWMKWHEIKALEDEGDYLEGVSDRLSYKVSLDRNGGLEKNPDYATEPIETFEVIYDMYINIDGKSKRVRTLWNVAKDFKLCLRAIRYPYDHNHSYLIPHNIKFTNNGLYQDGLGRMLQDLHIAGNATINHILNAATLANSLSLKAKEGSDAVRRIRQHQWYPSSVLELQNMDDAQQFQFATPNLATLINMFAIIERFASDVSGIVNYQLGIESPEDPEAPASKTIALMRKAEIKLRRYIKNLKRSEDEAGYQALRLIYQFISPEKLSEILDEEVDEAKTFLQSPLKIITQSSGFAIEKMFAKRDNATMVGMLFKDPLVAGDPERRARAWYTLAEDYGSGWDKKIIGIVPSPEEIKKEKLEKQQERQNKKIEAIKSATQQALQSGANEDEAREVGLEAGKKFDTLVQNQEIVMAQQQQQK